MKNNKKKGFTLVELLVVIAILAILATVSVVGYTSFIERANVAVDEDLASQLNHFLAAYQVKNNEKITPHNIRKITAEILELGGLDKLEPVSDGRNFYYDFANNQYVVMEDEKASNSNAAGMHFLVHAAGEPTSQFLGSSFTEGGNYFLVSTGGNKLADVINGFYSIDNNQLIDLTVLNQLVADAETLREAQPELANFVASSAVVHQDKKYHVTTEENKYLIIPDNANQIGSTSVLLNNENKEVELPLVSGQDQAVSIPDSIEYIAAPNLNNSVKLDMTGKTTEEVADLFVPQNDVQIEVGTTNGVQVSVTVVLDGKTVTVETHVVEQDGVKVSVNVVVETGKEPIPGTFDNPVKDFYISVTDADNMKNTGNRTNTAYVATEVGNFTVNVEYIGADENLPATGRNIVEWTLKSGSGAEGDDRTITFGADPSETIVLTAKSANGTERDFTIHVGKTTAATVELAGKFLNSTSTIYLVHGGKSNVHEIKLGDLSYNDAGKNLKLDTTLDVTYSGTGLTEENNVLTTSGNGTGTLTVKVGKYLTYTVNVVVFDKASLPVGTVENISVLAQGSATAPIKISDLFVANDASKIPADAEVRFTVIDADDQYVEFDRDYVSYVKDATGNAITSLAWTDTAGFYFSDVSGEDTIAISVFSKDGTRISDDVIVKVVSGDNARTWADINKEIKTNVVLLNNITFPADAQLVISGGTFYGNDFTLDVRAAKKDAAEHIIKLTNATLDGVNIVGKVYSTFTYQNHYASGTVDSTSIVVANNATIRNCYIANGRSPIRVKGNTRVEDSVIFGGKYCNIDVAKGVLTLAGDVTTINQKYEGTVGAGIVCDLTRDTNYVTMTDDCNLVQYNFIPKSAGSALPTVKITITLDLWITTVSGSIAVKMGTMVTSLIDDVNNTYDNWVYETKDANQNVTESYLNAGIVYLAATGDGASLVSKDNKSSGKWPDGYQLATYTETYHPGDDRLGLETKAHAYVYSPAKTNSANIDFENTWFKNATDAKYMEQYLPTNYVTGAMK